MLLQRRRGVSEVIAYVILIAISIIISSIVFLWVKSYVPTNEISCPDGVGILITDYSCKLNPENNSKIDINITIKNNGRFKIQGFYLKGTVSPEKSIATYSLGKESPEYQSGVLLIAQGLDIDKEKIYSLSEDRIYQLEIIPARVETIDQKRVFASCSQARVTENITCN